MIYLDRQHYYSIEGLPGKLQTGLLKGRDLARKIAHSGGDHLICRISRLVGCYFVLLLTLPFTIVGVVINHIFREKIDKDLFRREFELWNKIFYHYEGSNQLSHESLRAGSKELIIQLIRKRKKAADCPFKHILFHLASKSGSINLFYGDGIAPGLKKAIQNEEKCLIIFSPRDEGRFFKKFLKNSSNLSMSEVLKKFYQSQNELKQFVDPEKLEKVTWMWLKDIEKISTKKLQIFSKPLNSL